MRRHRILIVLVGLIVALSGGRPALADTAPPTTRERLEQALEQYARALEEPDRDTRIARFAQAEAGFAAVVAGGIENAALLTNLGNSALQAEAPGRAVLAYHRALRLDPDAQAARQNLAHVRGLLPGWVPHPGADDDAEPLLFYRRIASGHRSVAAALCFALGAASWAISVRRREGAWRGLAMSLGLLWILLFASTVFDSMAGEANRAVVTANEAFARSADSRLAALAYPEPLPAGVEVEILEDRGEWARVRLQNGRDVWLRASSVTRIAE